MKILSVIVSILIILFLMVGLSYCQSSKQEIYDKGIDYGMQGKFENAKKEFEDALAIDPFYEAAQNCLSLANTVISQKIEMETGIFLFKGIGYVNQSKLDQAINEYSKAIEINPMFAEVYNQRGIQYYRQGKYDQAIIDYTKAIEINPEFAHYYANRGKAYDKKSEYEKAIRDFDQAIQINPNNAPYYYDRGLSYYEHSKYDQAISDFTKAIKINPKFSDAFNNRGIAYIEKGHYKRSINDFTKAIEINPNHIEALKSRAYVYFVNLKNKAKACADWRRACELGDCENYNLARKNGDCQ